MRSVTALLVVALGVPLVILTLPKEALAERVCAYAIPVEMVDRVESAKAQSGNTFRFRTQLPEQLRDGTMVPAGSLGEGIIRSASAAGRKRHDGSLSLEPRYVTAKTRTGLKRVEVTMNPTLPVTWTPSEPLLQKAAGFIPMPIPGIAMQGINMIRYGRNITLGPGFTFSVIPVTDLSKTPVC